VTVGDERVDERVEDVALADDRLGQRIQQSAWVQRELTL
jgi:CRISPR/Cas system-associated endoribonuclease Cas2